MSTAIEKDILILLSDVARHIRTHADRRARGHGMTTSACLPYERKPEMPWHFYVLEFVSGPLLTNGVPHFVRGVSGHRFQSPFAAPRGVGESSPLINVLWGFANLAVGFSHCDDGVDASEPRSGSLWHVGTDC
jgi:hypothetical protein